MKKILIGFALFLIAAMAGAQQGLTNIVVEKYYVSTAADSIGSAANGSGVLPVGSVTYRLWAVMLPGYNFQALYGVPGHTLLVNTTTKFFNDENSGATSPTASAANMRKSAALLDSYFSVGGAAGGRVGVFKTEDTDGSPGNIPASGIGGPILQNNDPSTTGPINIGNTASLLANDGMIPGSPVAVTFVGINNTGNGDLGILDATNTVAGPQFFSTANGSVAALGGAVGPTAANRILIGQFTTTGIFHFELNAQIGTPSAGVQNYVASSPVGSEITQPFLTGTYGVPNTPPVVSITAPANNSSYIFPATINVTVNATDADGTISKVVLKRDGTPYDSLTTGGPNYNFVVTGTSVGSHNFTAVATDNSFGQTTSGQINFTVGNNIAPTISITAPANGTPYVAPAAVNITTNANDPDGTVAQVEFLVDNVVVGTVLAPGPFNFSWVSGAPFGSRQLKARATDNNNAQATSAIVTITVSDPNALAYGVVSASNTCVPSNFCLSVEARDTVNNVIGYDVVMHYDNTKVTPTGVVTVDNDLVNPSHVDVINNVDAANGLVYISLFFNGSAPANSEFHGVGNIFCVEFTKTGSFANVDTTHISIQSLQESYITGVASVPADLGTYSTFRDTSFGGKLRFWFNNSPITYNSAIPSQHLITNIYGTDNACGNQSAVAVQPDVNGDFVYDINNGPKISIKKDITPATSVQPVVNGFDAFLTRRVLVNDLAFLPTVFQMIAMDVNTDGVVSAGDLSQINQRTVLILPEYRQDWNYDASGNPLGPLSKDWLFIDNTTVNTNTGYLISTTYPFDDGVGYSKFRVPQVPFCVSLPSSSADTSGNCAILVTETYKGILLGDVNGNFATALPNNLFRENGTDRVIFDITKAVVGNGYVDVPVSIQYGSDVNALDFAMKFNESKLSLNSVIDHTGHIESLANYNANDKTFRFTSYSLQKYETSKPVLSVRFNTTGQITTADLNSLEAYVNGERVGVALGLNTDNMVTLFPNPATDMLNVIVSEDANVQLLDMSGSEVAANTLIYANQKREINTANLSSGVYMLKVSSENFISVKKVVIQK